MSTPIEVLDEETGEWTKAHEYDFTADVQIRGSVYAQTPDEARETATRDLVDFMPSDWKFNDPNFKITKHEPQVYLILGAEGDVEDMDDFLAEVKVALETMYDVRVMVEDYA